MRLARFGRPVAVRVPSMLVGALAVAPLVWSMLGGGPELVSGAAASMGWAQTQVQRDGAAAQARPGTLVPGPRDIHVVRMVPAGVQPDPGMTDEAVERAVASASAYWSEQTGGAVSFRVASLSSWVSSTHTCRDVAAIWDEAARVASAGPEAHLMVVVPRAAGDRARGCDLGFASLDTGDRAGRTYVTALHPPLLAHELGHNLGLAHAGALVCDGRQDAVYDGRWPAGCQVLEYDDLFDVMGYSGEGYGRGYVGAVGLDTLGVQGAGVRTVGASTADVTLVPFSRVDGGVRVLKIEVPGEPVYFVEYRTGEGRDAEAAAGGWSPSTGVRILRRNPATGGSLELDASPGGWRYDRALPTGGTFTSASGRIRVTLRRADGAGADIDVTVS